jgi:adenine-specific DNA-methyltransferase
VTGGKNFGGRKGQLDLEIFSTSILCVHPDNYHALQLLEYLYAGKVDCIYIDPPYNTGARDWKYNNDYVDDNDNWMHSKWLAFMKRRLSIAKRLLNPKSSVLIVTIDEKEYLRLGLLLEGLFPVAKIQMVSSVINPKGTGRANEMLRVNEFIFFLWFGTAQLGTFEAVDQGEEVVAWETMRRRNLASQRGRKGKGACGPNQFYPIYVNRESGHIQAIGEPLPETAPIGAAPKTKGCAAVFPIRPDGTEMNWSLTVDTCRLRWQQGYVRAGRHTPDQPQEYIIQFLPSGAISAIESGDAEITERREDGSVEARYTAVKNRTPTTHWNIKSHYAEHNGTNLLKEILPNCVFPFPKSVYAVRDAIRLFVSNKPNAVIVDFFSGSGTTLNAVNLLNATDGGKRQCIMVTNNEVSEGESHHLKSQGLQQGQPEWEQHGICQSVTWPRSKYTILGKRDEGSELEGEYLSSKIVEKKKARKFQQIGFTSIDDLKTAANKKQLVALLGKEKLAQSLVKKDSAFVVSEKHPASILFDDAQADAWLEALEDQGHITDFYIVSASKSTFDDLKARIHDLLGPMIVTEEEKRPMREGFSANLEYFRLDFLDKDHVALGREFREILPILWLRAGAIGPRPELPKNTPIPAMVFPERNPFAVLVDETRFADFAAQLEGRDGLTHIYLVTDSEEAFQEMAGHLKSPNVIQLYRDYLENFVINKGECAQ